MDVRSSNSHIIKSQALRIAPSSIQEEIHLFLDRRRILDIQIGQFIRTTGALNPKERIYVSHRLGPIPSGFLILRSGSPAIYWNKKISSASIVHIPLEMRELEKIGALVLSATYYANERKMVVEDIIYYNGKNVWATETFTQRWNTLGQICSRVLRPDTVAQGFEIVTIQPESISSWLNRHSFDGVFAWEFIIDKPGWRRVIWRTSVIAVHAPKKVPQLREPDQSLQQLQVESSEIFKSQDVLIALLKKDTTTTLPDSYIIYAADHSNQGPPAVKKLTLSLALRAALQTDTTCKVKLQFNDNFKKYEVVEIVHNNSPVAEASTFHKRI